MQAAADTANASEALRGLSSERNFSKFLFTQVGVNPLSTCLGSIQI